MGPELLVLELLVFNHKYHLIISDEL